MLINTNVLISEKTNVHMFISETTVNMVRSTNSIRILNGVSI